MRGKSGVLKAKTEPRLGNFQLLLLKVMPLQPLTQDRSYSKLFPKSSKIQLNFRYSITEQEMIKKKRRGRHH